MAVVDSEVVFLARGLVMEIRADLVHSLQGGWSQVLYDMSSQLTHKPTVICALHVRAPAVISMATQEKKIKPFRVYDAYV